MTTPSPSPGPTGPNGTLAARTTQAAPPDAPRAPAAARSGLGTERTTVLPVVERLAGQPELHAVPQARYETIAELGRGGMGEVLKVADNDIQRTVAVKRLLPGTGDAATLARFVEEIRIVGQLEHPGIVPVHDVGVDADGQHYFVMKYVEGETLEAIIDGLAKGDRRYHERYTVERRVDIFIGILEAVHYAHERGIVHRDIKPANVMVGPFGEVVLMDWGIAKRLAGAPLPAREPSEGADEPQGARRPFRTMEGALTGTPAYMSPEQARGAEIDGRSDVYGLCVLLHELLGLRHYLADAGSLGEVLNGVLETDPPLLTLVRSPHQSPTPADLTHIVRKGVRKDPNERYQSVGELLDRLRARKEGYFPIECPLTFTKRLINALTHFVDRHPLITVALLALGLLSTLGGLTLGALRLLGVA